MKMLHAFMILLIAHIHSAAGTSMSTSDGITQSTAWVAGETYYIKCQDSFGNQPAPDSCSIVLSASQS